MKNILTLCLALTLMLIGNACGGGGGPELTVTTPNNNAEYVPGDSFKISGSATSEIGLASIDIFSSTLGLDGKVTQFNNNTNVNFEITVDINPNTSSGEYIIEIRAFDLENNVTEIERTIKIL